MNALVVLVVGLGLAGLLPALAVAGQSLVVLFLAPLIGAGMAAVGATIELGAGGSLGADYAVVAVIVNLAVIAWWLRTRRAARPRTVPAQLSPKTWGWSVLTVVVLLACMAYPLTALRAAMFGWDANSIWLTHALMAYGGHHDLLTGLQNPAYQFSNPDYPPLVPAAGALAFEFFGTGNLHLAPDMTVLLTACALGVLGIGIAATGTGAAAMAGGIGGATASAGKGAPRAGRIAAIVAAGIICLVAFAVSDPYAVEGYTDLLWAAPAAGAVVWGLMLPPSRQALGVAWICAAAASLTKNEGLTSALVIIVLIALRYRPLSLPGPGGAPLGRARSVRGPSRPAGRGLGRAHQAHRRERRVLQVRVHADTALPCPGDRRRHVAAPARAPGGARGAASRVAVPAPGPDAQPAGEPGVAVARLPGLAGDHLRHVPDRLHTDSGVAAEQCQPDDHLRPGGAVHRTRGLDGDRGGRRVRLDGRAGVRAGFLGWRAPPGNARRFGSARP